MDVSSLGFGSRAVRGAPDLNASPYAAVVECAMHIAVIGRGEGRGLERSRDYVPQSSGGWGEERRGGGGF